MSFEQDLRSITLVAAADLSAKQYRFVKVDTAGKAALSGVGATDTSVGVLQNNPTSGQMATVGYTGVTKAFALGVIAPGALVTSDANGKATTATTGDQVRGIAMNEANTAANDIFPVMLLPIGKI